MAAPASSWVTVTPRAASSAARPGPGGRSSTSVPIASRRTAAGPASRLRSAPMPGAILAADTGGITGAAIVLVITLGLAVAALRVLRDALRAVDLSPQADTRLRFLRRVVVAALLLVGLTLAVAQFGDLH